MKAVNSLRDEMNKKVDFPVSSNDGHSSFSQLDSIRDDILRLRAEHLSQLEPLKAMLGAALPEPPPSAVPDVRPMFKVFEEQLSNKICGIENMVKDINVDALRQRCNALEGRLSKSEKCVNDSKDQVARLHTDFHSFCKGSGTSSLMVADLERKISTGVKARTNLEKKLDFSCDRPPIERDHIIEQVVSLEAKLLLLDNSSKVEDTIHMVQTFIETHTLSEMGAREHLHTMLKVITALSGDVDTIKAKIFAGASSSATSSTGSSSVEVSGRAVPG